ncbi:MAG: FAD-dependent oxidoreductase [Pseudomonadota bacterium]
MMDADVLIIGAGPAGSAAALEVDRAGLSAVIVDEQLEAGGQVYRSPRVQDSQSPGHRLRQELDGSGVVRRFGHRVWTVEREKTGSGFRIWTVHGGRSHETRAKALIVATGAIERNVPFPGWTLPGVSGLAAATVLLKAQNLLPGSRTVVAGAGPLLYLVATSILRSGGTVAALVDATPLRRWVSPVLMGNPALLAKGALWWIQLQRASVPIYRGWAVKSATGGSRLSAVELAPLDAFHHTSETIDADSLCIGYGLRPSTEYARLLRADCIFRAGEGWGVDVDNAQRTSLPGLYACGDGARIMGVADAPHSGRRAAQSALKDLGVAVRPVRPSGKISGGTRRRFAAHMNRISKIPDILYDAMPDATIVCRCEGVRRETIDAAITDGARTLADVKSETRCGMGSCGGRQCLESVAALLSDQTEVDLPQLGVPRPRPPLRPVTIGELVGTFDYADLPTPRPSPL